jgi:hypothetical protein
VAHKNRRENGEENRERQVLEQIEHRLRKIERLLDSIFFSKIPSGVLIKQGGNMITGVQAGGPAAIFEADPVPSTIPFPAGTVDTWTTDDPAVQLTPSPTDPSQVQVLVPATDLAVDFGLSVSTQMPGVASPFTNTVRVAIIPAAATLPTGVQINQVAAVPVPVPVPVPTTTPTGVTTVQSFHALR